jgi:FAD-linked oxidoreductase
MGPWKNWSGGVTCAPETFAQPETLEALCDLVRTAPKARMAGSRHSFMPLWLTDQVLINLDRLPGVLEVAEDRQTVWAPAGATLKDLTAALWTEGLSLLNQGDINAQTLGGACATGTHGTGQTLGNLASHTQGFRVVLADGELVECDAAHRPELFQALRLSLGLLGVVVAIKLKVAPAYHLQERIFKLPLDAALERFDELAADHRHFEFFAFPYADEVLVKTLDPVDPNGEFEPPEEDDEALLAGFCEMSAAAPPLIPDLQRLLMRYAPSEPTPRQGPAFQIFPSTRVVRNEEMEYEVPRAEGVAAVRDVIAAVKADALPVCFPLMVRTVAADDIWISPQGQGPCTAISFHQYPKLPWREFFPAIEARLRARGGRPHWAKHHTLGAIDVRALYPRLDSFLAAREAADPDGKLLNGHLGALFAALS